MQGIPGFSKKKDELCFFSKNLCDQVEWTFSSVVKKSPLCI